MAFSDWFRRIFTRSNINSIACQVVPNEESPKKSEPAEQCDEAPPPAEQYINPSNTQQSNTRKDPDADEIIAEDAKCLDELFGFDEQPSRKESLLLSPQPSENRKKPIDIESINIRYKKTTLKGKNSDDNTINPYSCMNFAPTLAKELMANQEHSRDNFWGNSKRWKRRNIFSLEEGANREYILCYDPVHARLTKPVFPQSSQLSEQSPPRPSKESKQHSEESSQLSSRLILNPQQEKPEHLIQMGKRKSRASIFCKGIGNFAAMMVKAYQDSQTPQF